MPFFVFVFDCFHRRRHRLHHVRHSPARRYTAPRRGADRGRRVLPSAPRWALRCRSGWGGRGDRRTPTKGVTQRVFSPELRPLLPDGPRRAQLFSLSHGVPEAPSMRRPSSAAALSTPPHHDAADLQVSTAYGHDLEAAIDDVLKQAQEVFCSRRRITW